MPGYIHEPIKTKGYSLLFSAATRAFGVSTEHCYTFDDTSFEVTVKKNLLSDLTDEAPTEDRVKVFLRIRPFTELELSKNENQDVIKVESDTSLLVHAPSVSQQSHRSTVNDTSKRQRFTFSHIFNEDANQKCLFDKAVLPVLKDFINGHNCLLFTYGVTNSGKTYTIHGDTKDSGILPRALDVVFNSISNCQYSDSNLKPEMFCDVTRLDSTQLQTELGLKQSVLSHSLNCTHDDNSSKSSTSHTSAASSSDGEETSPDLSLSDDEDDIATVVANRKRNCTSIDVRSQGDIRFVVFVSFAEIYNEQIFDLLVSPPTKKTCRRQVLQLREDKQGRPYIKGLRELQVSSADEAFRVMSVGRRNLHIASTKLNQSSSRSHCIFTIKLVRVVDKDQPNFARVSMLSFCDLAGSERNNKTQGFGERLKEAGNINSSLLTLGRCITILRQNQANRANQQQIVPFRESKLTRLFQSFFAGKGHVSMIVNISPCASIFDETLFAIKYSAIAQQVVVSKASLSELMPKVEAPVVKVVEEKRNPSHAANRDTIAWASPGTYAKLLEDGRMSVHLGFTGDDNPIADSNDLDNLVDESYYESISDVEEWHRERLELKNVISKLQDKLMEMHQQSLKDAARIRDEVCEEMQKQIVLIENNYQESLRVQNEIQEDKYEKKLSIFKDAMEKTKKRKRMDDEDEFQVLMMEKDKAWSEAQESLRRVCVERDEAVRKLTDVQFSLATLKEILKAKEIQIAEDKERTSKLEHLTRLNDKEIKHLLEQLEERDKTILSLKEQLLKEQRKRSIPKELIDRVNMTGGDGLNQIETQTVAVISRTARNILESKESFSSKFSDGCLKKDVGQKPRNALSLAKRRRLMSKNDTKLVATPEIEDGLASEETVDPHQVVRRRLRERQL